MIKKLLILLIGINLSLHVLAQQPTSIGTVISLQGQAAAVTQAKQQRPLQRRSEIYLNDRIVTQQESQVQFKLLDDSVIIVRPASEFYVSEFSFDKNAPRSNKYVGNIVKGALLNISGQGDSKNYQLKSPLTTIAFRGTHVNTILITKNNKPVDQEVFVSSGWVIIKSQTGEERRIGAGQESNSAIVNSIGRIKVFNSSGLVSDLGKSLIGGGGGIAVKCKTGGR